MHMITALYLTTIARVEDLRTRMTEERGQTSLEWLGIGVVVIAVLLFVASQSETIGGAVQTAFTDLIDRVMGRG